MNKRSLRILEFNKILSMVTEYATSPMAKRRVDRMKPQRDIEQIRKLQEETNDALNRLNRHGNISFSGLCDIGASIKRLEVQGTLTSKELLDIAAVLQVAKAAKQYLKMHTTSEKFCFNRSITREMIVCNLRFCICHTGQECGFTNIRESN